MKYEVTKEHADRFESVVNEDDNSDVRACITRALEDFVAGIPEPTPSTTGWIKIRPRVVNLRYAVEISNICGDFQVRMSNGDHFSVSLRDNPDGHAEILSFFDSIGRPKGDA